MYEALDKFMNIETWYTSHALDRGRFLESLEKIVGNNDFNADNMADYMRKKANVSSSDEGEIAEAIRDCQRDAWAISDYIKGCGNYTGIGR